MKLFTKAVKLNSDPKITISLITSQVQEMLGLGYELKSHVVDGKGHVLLTYQPSTERLKYSYSIERVIISDNVEETIAAIDKTNERMDRIGYSQKSMFLDGFGNYIISYYKKNENNRRAVTKGGTNYGRTTRK